MVCCKLRLDNFELRTLLQRQAAATQSAQGERRLKKQICILQRILSFEVALRPQREQVSTSSVPPVFTAKETISGALGGCALEEVAKRKTRHTRQQSSGLLLLIKLRRGSSTAVSPYSRPLFDRSSAWKHLQSASLKSLWVAYKQRATPALRGSARIIFLKSTLCVRRFELFRSLKADI